MDHLLDILSYSIFFCNIFHLDKKNGVLDGWQRQLRGHSFGYILASTITLCHAFTFVSLSIMNICKDGIFRQLLKSVWMIMKYFNVLRFFYQSRNLKYNAFFAYKREIWWLMIAQRQNLIIHVVATQYWFKIQVVIVSINSLLISYYNSVNLKD